MNRPESITQNCSEDKKNLVNGKQPEVTIPVDVNSFSQLFDTGYFENMFLPPKKKRPKSMLEKVSCLPVQLCSFFSSLWSRKEVGLMRTFAVVLFIAVFGLILGTLLFISKIFTTILQTLLKYNFSTLVTHGYPLPIAKHFHIGFQTFFSRFSSKEEYFHSRFLDVRSEFLFNGKLFFIYYIPLLADNYCYLILNHDTKVCVVVDCADARATRFAIRQISKKIYGKKDTIQLKGILSTHKHWDHTAGNIPMQKLCNGEVKIFGHVYDEVPGCTNVLFGDDLITVKDLQVDIDVYHMPCHTKGSVVYKIRDDQGKDYLFTGDTLFHGNCGAHFEGKPEMMVTNFAKIISISSKDALFFPGHEYSSMALQGNLKSLAKVGPENYFTAACELYLATHKRNSSSDSLPNVPVSLRSQKLVNNTFIEVRKHQEKLARFLYVLALLKNRFDDLVQQPINSSVTKQEANMKQLKLTDVPGYRLRNGSESNLNPFMIMLKSELSAKPTESVKSPKKTDENKHNKTEATYTNPILTAAKAWIEKKKLKNIGKDLTGKEKMMLQVSLNQKILKHLHAIATEPMATYMMRSSLRNKDQDKPSLIQIRNEMQKKALFSDKVKFNLDKLSKNWVSREKVLALIEDIDPVAARIFTELVWKQGGYASALVLSLRMAGFTELKDASFLRSSTNEISPDKVDQLKPEEKKAKKKKKTKREKIKKDAAYYYKDGRKIWFNLGFKKITELDLSDETKFEVPKPKHRLDNCPICSLIYEGKPSKSCSHSLTSRESMESLV
eukprot:maker-scaffold_98-snap-gene-0.21-mRNA-1 protein AED:0.05 eAED:0.05 QI:47/1/0.5/1/1/1/2/0/780